MNSSNENSINASTNSEYVEEPGWFEDDFEEIQQETAWEIFSSELNNWSTINSYAANF